MRRTRYVIETAERGRVECLAYSREDAERIAGRNGLTVVSIAPKRRGNAGREAAWKVDERAIRAACAALDIRWPVKIRRTRAQATDGTHRLRARSRLEPTPTHHITANADAYLLRASEILWHELTHAAQAERCARAAGGEDPVSACRAWQSDVNRSRRWAYSDRPIEVEAREAEKRAWAEPLVVPT